MSEQNHPWSWERPDDVRFCWKSSQPWPFLAAWEWRVVARSDDATRNRIRLPYPWRDQTTLTTHGQHKHGQQIAPTAPYVCCVSRHTLLLFKPPVRAPVSKLI
eukprot:1160045-Pelagomonas_calceolata.AAC.5